MSIETRRISDIREPAATLVRKRNKPEMVVGMAKSDADLRDSQRLRYHIFAEEVGARLKTDIEGLDTDPYDPYCQHLIVRDRANGNRVVASTRILFDMDAEIAGGFYSSTEFNLAPLLAQKGRIMEIGRTCVHPDYRSGSAISLLWMGLARFVDINSYTYMIGCASIPMYDGGAGALAAYAQLSADYLVEDALRVTPRLPLPHRDYTAVEPELPPLLKAYMRLGARIAGEPCWDPAFNCADLLVVLRPADLRQSYLRRFLGVR